MAETERPTHPASADDAWARTARHASRTTFFFDFDGVLSPITEQPEESRPVAGIPEVLDRLAARVARVAIVSARPVTFLRTHFASLAHVDLFGLYGLEVWHEGQVVTKPAALDYEEPMKELAAAARGALERPVEVEYKRLAVALHYRKDPARAAQVEKWALEQAEQHGLLIQRGRMVVELKPPVDQDKGMVITEAVRDAGCAWYFGDDMSDVKAFDALRAREAVDPGFFGMAIAVANDETGAEVSNAADLTLASPEAVARFLDAGLQTF
ncbi:trehalose phosphatase [Actinoplanes sp. SE50]|uniref:trehalose-phosphatase n=1 Tax=unclassified Actinoplanes TaxID=2626549 RepID=UPI00023EDD3B|nr:MULTISPECIES: trehalose-phosphatase [unclassified Actinoplanes]AEV88589.1 HAD family hydrolase [Actinoplanes sp. SE50/110]ATO86994.1 trehalose phosphatase [Actinoplanes sp. SE50]SLM04412.1 trehalose-phosphatase [Actinoplanes sp. SE50/110]